MGYGTYSARDWDSYSSATTSSIKSKGFASTFKVSSASAIDPGFVPDKITLRESCDSADNPESTAVILAIDVTGSMGQPLATKLVTETAGKAFDEFVKRAKDPKGKMVTDPHLMVMAVGDAEMGDDAPLQVAQFESKPEVLATQVEKMFIECGGGGNGWESYLLPLYFAATRTSIDCFNKRGKKGFIFTIGDELPQPVLHKSVIKKVFGDDVQSDLSAAQVIEMVERQYHYYHIIESSRRAMTHLHGAWKDVIGERVIILKDVDMLGEVMAAILEVVGGRDKADVVASFGDPSSSKALVISTAVAGVVAAGGTAGSGTGVTLFD